MAHRDYDSETLTVHWDSEICSHSGHCARALGAVFRPSERPWIQVSGADDEAIATAVDGCPSGALAYTRHGADPVPTPTATVTIRLAVNGPYEVRGPVNLVDTHGNLIRTVERLALCRCGESPVRPYCDGSHRFCGFKDPGVPAIERP